MKKKTTASIYWKGTFVGMRYCGKVVFLEEEELEEVAAILGFNMSPEAVDKAFGEMDRDKKGRVSIEDFGAWWTKSSNSPFRKKLSERLGLNAASDDDLRNMGPGIMFG